MNKVLTTFRPVNSSTPTDQNVVIREKPVAPKKQLNEERKQKIPPPPPPKLPIPNRSQKKVVQPLRNESDVASVTSGASSFSIMNLVHVDDILLLPTITPVAVLELLRNRFSRDDLYTHLGHLVLAVNPYKQMKDLYSDTTNADYSKKTSANSGQKHLAPHLFSIGNDALASARKHAVDQIISISGESGSGKTESARILIQYIVNNNNANANNSKLKKICQHIMDGLGIMESFGNASTAHNFNSSRHGRLIDLGFLDAGKLITVQVSDYLLERSRVVCHSKTEKNYHIFYEFIGGLSDDQRRSYKLDMLVTCDYFATGLPEPTEDMKDRFASINSCLVSLGFNAEELKALWAMLASVCHLGTIKFDRYIGENGVVGDLKLASLKPLQTISELMQLSEGTLASLLTVKTTDAGGERLSIPLTPEKAFVVRDAIAKSIYAKLFSWISRKINRSLTTSLQSSINSIDIKSAKIIHIGILDIFGFEDFSRNNSLEQLCINFASESLHAYFLKEVVKMEQESYIRDGLKWKKIELKDNANCIDLLTNKSVGIMTILDDHCFMPTATDASFLNKCNELSRYNTAYARAKSSEEFGIAHYAGKVWYNARGFLEKNRDANRPDITDLLVKSRNPIIASVFSTNAAKTANESRVISAPRRTRCFTTVSSMYQESLSQLISIINRCEPHFVRCIRPNRNKKPGYFDTECVLDQLRCGGIIDAARVRKAGYPARFKHSEFVSTYAPMLVSSESVESLRPTEACDYILHKIGAAQIHDYQIGRSMVFLTDSIFRRLEAEIGSKRWSAIAKWQNAVFRFLEKQREAKRVEEESIRQRELEEIQAARAAHSAKREKTRNDDSAIGAPSPLIQPLQNYGINKDALKEVIAYLQGWQIVNDDRHIVPANNNLASLSTLIPSDMNLLKTVIGAFMQTSFLNKSSRLHRASDSTPHHQDVSLVSKIFSMFVSEEQQSGLEQFVMATLIVAGCQAGSVDSFLSNVQSLISHQSLANSWNVSSHDKSQDRLTGDYVIHEILRSLSAQHLSTQSKTLLWVLLLHLVSSYDMSANMAKSILSAISADNQQSLSLTAPHLVLFVYQKLFPVIRQLVSSSWTSTRILPPSLLEWISNIRLLRMALSVAFVDSSACNMEVTSHSTTEDFASTCIRTKFQVSNDTGPQLLYSGWTVALVFQERERVELWPEAKLLDLISHIELPQELQMKGRFPGLGLIRSVPAVVGRTPAPANSDSSFPGSGFAQISVGKPKPRQTSTPKTPFNAMNISSTSKQVSFEDDSENPRKPSVSSTNSNLAKIDSYINNLFDFGNNSVHVPNSSNQNNTESVGQLSTIQSVSSGPNGAIDTRSLYTHLSNTENVSSRGSIPPAISASTNVRQAARILDRFLKPDMINVQQSNAQQAVAMLTKSHFRSAFTNEGNSLFKLVSLLDKKLGPNSVITPEDSVTPFVTYSNIAWNLNVFKAFLTPNEAKFLLDSDRFLLRLIVAQIVGDVESTRPGHFCRLSASEHASLLNFIEMRKMTKQSILSADKYTSSANVTKVESALDVDILKTIFRTALETKLYFSAIYPVQSAVDESGSSTIITDLALSPTCLSLLARRIDPTTSSRILDVVLSFSWLDVEDVVIAGESMVKVAVANTGEFAFSTENIDLLADRLSAFTIEAQASVVFIASRESVPAEPTDRQLVLQRGDIIYVLDAQPQDGLLYGSCRGRCGFFPITVVTPYDFSTIPIELRRHFSDRRIQDCDLIVDTSALSDEHYNCVENWLHRGDPEDRPPDQGDNLSNLINRLSLRRQKENAEQRAKGGDVSMAVENSEEVILLNVTDDLRPLCGQCNSLIAKYLNSDFDSNDTGSRRELISGILATGIQYPLITDEIFLQCVKPAVLNRTTGGSDISIHRILSLLVIISKFFRCSDTLRPYIYQFLSSQLVSGKNREIVLECSASMVKLALMGSRRSPPSQDELEYGCMLGQGRRNSPSPLFVRIFLPGQRRVAVYVDSCSLVREVVDAVMSAIGVEVPRERVGVGSSSMKLSLTNSFEYRLYYRRSPKEPFLLVSGASFVLDLFKSASHSDTAPQHLDLVIRRLSWLAPVKPLLTAANSANTYLVDMISFQMIRTWLEANWSPLNADSSEELTKFVATVAALHHRASIAPTEERPPSASELSTLMPRWVYHLRPDWLRVVQQTYFDVAAKLSSSSARLQMTALLIKQCPLGAATFYILFGAVLPSSSIRGAALLGLNAKGVVVIHPETRAPVFYAAYNNILSIAVENNPNTSNISARQQHSSSVQVIVRMSPNVMMPPDAQMSDNSSKLNMKQAPVVMRLMSLPSDNLIQVLQHHMDLYAALNKRDKPGVKK